MRMTASVLDAIVAGARRSALDRAATMRAAVDREAADATPDPQAFLTGLTEPGVRVIAECKRRSPSRGVLRRDYDPVAIARGYQAAGAAAISVLTEPSFFDGSVGDLRAVRAAVRIPILRKDFIVIPFQIDEARAAGADAVLLIVAALADAELSGMIEAATFCGLSTLVEVHSVEEARRAVGCGAPIVGVNSRDLRTLEMNPHVFEKVASVLPKGVVAIAESGISSAAEVIRLRGLGYQAFLIGERFMTMPDPGDALRGFLAEAGTGATS
jgi:indole-3-glycerol phosphate synthase